MNLTGSIVFECGNTDCKEHITVDASEFDLQNTSSDERDMGSEEFYEDTVEKNCPNCNTQYNIHYECSEYPVGAPNYEDLHIDKPFTMLEKTLTVS